MAKAASSKKRSVRLPKDIQHGCAWLTNRNYVRWQVRLNGRSKTSENKEPGQAFEAMRRAILELDSTTTQTNEMPWLSRPLRAWCEEVLDHRARHLEPTTRDLYRGTIEKWVLSLNDWTPLGQIDKGWISILRSRLADALFAEEMSWHHYRNITTAFGLCLREAFDQDLLDEDLSIHLRLKKAERKKLLVHGRIARRGIKGRRYVSAEDWARLVKSFEGHWLYGPLLLGSLTGMRTAEVAGLKWQHVHLEEPVPYIEVVSQTKRVRGQGLVDKCPKYNSVGEVPLVQSLADLLRELPRSGDYVFLNSRGNPLDVAHIAKTLKDRVTTLNIFCLDGALPVFSDLARRALASERSRAGLDPRVGAEIARHSVEIQEQVYEQETRQILEVRTDGLAALEAISAGRLRALEGTG